MKFVAKKLDLTLELTLLSGETVTIEPAINVSSAVQAENILAELTRLEKNVGKSALLKEGEISATQCIDAQLNIIYGEQGAGKDFWSSNLDAETLRQCIQYVCNTIAGLKKSE